MHRLSRTVRLVFNDPPERPTKGHGHAGSPTPVGLPRFYELQVVCRGEPDADSGYLIDIKTIDDAARTHASPLIARAIAEKTRPEPLLPALFDALARVLPVPLDALTLRLTPRHAIDTTRETRTMPTVTLRQTFEFAASHRLHVQGKSDEENRRLFGKCNNPAGHGHNYRVEPAIDVDPADESRPSFHDIERLVDAAVLEPFDHTHLNEDTADFGPSGVIPSVENIAKVCHDRLASALADAFPSARLRAVTVWETERTSATYPA